MMHTHKPSYSPHVTSISTQSTWDFQSAQIPCLPRHSRRGPRLVTRRSTSPCDQASLVVEHVTRSETARPVEAEKHVTLFVPKDWPRAFHQIALQCGLRCFLGNTSNNPTQKYYPLRERKNKVYQLISASAS